MTRSDITVTLHSFGTTLEVVFPDHIFFRAFQKTLPPHWSIVKEGAASISLQIVENDTRTQIDPTYDLYVDGKIHALNLSAAVMGNLLTEKLDYYLGEFSNQFAFVHAGVVRWQEEVTLLPGRSHAGKTTLTAALVQAGAEYVSDDLAIIGPDGRVQLFSQPMRLRPDVAPGFNLSATTAYADEANTGTTPIAGILFLRYCADQRITLQPLSKGEATINLMANCLNARHHPQMVMQHCAAAAQRAWCAEGVRGEAASAADYILNHVVTTWRFQ